MSRPTIKVGPIPDSNSRNLVRGKIPPEKCFTFSLQYWREIENFGVGAVPAKWTISLLHRLCELSKERVSRLLEEPDPDFKEGLRYHPIDWDARAIPLTRDQLNWLPPFVRDNPNEFPIVQFHISKTFGRVHGFWDHQWCFNIVLLDPLHNLQPSGDVGYRVRSTRTSTCEVSSLRTALDSACAKPCSDLNCRLSKAVRELAVDGSLPQYTVVARIAPDVAEKLHQLRQRGSVSVSEALEYGITFFDEKPLGPAVS
jgi:hypothetical protein